MGDSLAELYKGNTIPTVTEHADSDAVAQVPACQGEGETDGTQRFHNAVLCLLLRYHALSGHGFQARM